MKVFRGEKFAETKNPTPGKTYKKDILKELNAQGLHGVFGLVVPHGQGGDYHHHERGEHIIVIVSGEGLEVVEGGEVPVKAGDVLYIPAGEKHTIVNRSDKELRYLGFMTQTAGVKDRIEQKWVAVPDVPKEASIEHFEVTSWHGLLSPAGTPRDIINRLNTEWVKIVADPDSKEKMQTADFETIAITPEQFSEFIKQDIARWSKVVKEANLSFD